MLRKKSALQGILREIEGLLKARGRVRIMEVCGTHTVSIFQHGIKSMLPHEISLISGPGCPVCVTSQGDIDQMIGLSLKDGVQIVTFGDMLKVPGTKGSLKHAMARGARVHVVYSPMDAITFCQRHPTHEVVFLGIGFETTAPAIASVIKRAKTLGIENFSVFASMKLIPPALYALLSSGEVETDALLCPGHVSSIIGAHAYGGIAKDFGIPCVVSGFEPGDILLAIWAILRQLARGEARVENMYKRAVTDHGNERAKAVMDEVLCPEDTVWRGLGTIPGSGLGIRQDFHDLCAKRRFSLVPEDVPEPRGCACGEILKGKKAPPDCPLFGKRCTPSSPVGPCMVSTEGTCQAYYRFGGIM